MSRSSVKRNAARPKSAVQSAPADGTGTSAGLPSEQTREMEAQYRSIFEAAGEAMVIANLDGFIVEANPAACQIYGYTHDELVGLPASMLVHPADLIAESAEAARAGGSSLRQGVGLHRDGSLFHAEGRVTGFTFKGEPHVLVVVRDITERVQAEERLREREAQYRSIFESSLDAISIVDMEGRTVEVNPAFCEMVGYSRDELIGMPGSALVHPGYQHVNAEAMQTIQGGGEVRTEMTLVRKDGSPVQVDGRAGAFTYKGEPHFLGVSRDITDRVQAEEQLREKEEQYRSIFEASTDGLGIVDMEGRFAEVNPAYCKLTGYSHGELIGTPVTALVHPDYHHLIAEGMQAISEGRDVRTPSVLVRKDGTFLHIEGGGTQFTYRGKPHFLGMARDITERLEAEEQRREQEEQYRAIFESTIDGLVILDLHGTIVEANTASCEMFGYARDELIGLNAAVLTPPEGLPELAEALQRAAEENQIPHSAAAKSIRKDGSLLDVESQGRPFIYKGRPHLLAVVRDITDRVRAEEQLREKEEQYRSVFEAATDGLVIQDFEGHIVEINPAYCQMLGYTRDELIGKHIGILIPPEHYHLIAESMQSIGAGDTPQARVVVLRKDGTELQVEGHGVAFQLNGKPHILGVARDITERVRAEERMREKEAQYRSIFEATTDGLGVLDMEGHIVEVNPAYCQMYGYTREEVIGLHALALMHPDYHHLLADGMRSIVMGNPVQVRSAGLRKDGTSFPVDGRGTTFLFNGKPHILGISRDITEQVQAEEELREREAEYGAVFEATTDGLVINDLETGVIVEANPAFCRMHGYTHEEMVGMHPSKHIRPDCHHLFGEYVRTVSRGATFHTEAVDVRKGNTDFPVDVSGRAFTFRGKPSVLGIVRDVTERVQAEEQLREKEEQYRSIFESSADGLGIYDQQGFLVEANPAYCRMLGYSHDELVGLHASVTVHPEYHHVIAEGLERVNRDVPFRREIVLLRKDGTSFPAEAGATTFMYKGTPHELVVLRDISERVEAEKQIREREAEYRDVFEATNDGLIICDLEGHTVEVNSAQCTMFGYTHDEMTGLNAMDLVAPDSYDTVVEAFRELEARGSCQAVVTGLRKDGTTFYTDARSTRFMYRGKPHNLSVNQDVTERVRAYELLEQRVEERTRELSTLLDVSHNVSSTLELQPLMEVILDQLEEVVEYAGASVSLVDSGETRIVAFRGRGSAAVALNVRVPLQQSALFQLWQGADPLIIDDVRHDDSPEAVAFRKDDAVLMDDSFSYVRSWMAVPMVVNERLVGILTLNGAEPGLYTPHHAELVLGIASQAAIAIENARLYEQTVQRTSELSALLDVSRNVASTLELEPLLNLILDQLNLVADNDGITLLEVRGDVFVVLLRRVPGHEDQEFPQSYTTQSHGPIWEKLRRGEVVVIGDVRGDDVLARAYQETVGDYLNTSLSFEKSFMAVPLMLKDRIIGLLGLTSARPDYYTPHHGELALAIAQQAAIAMENARLYEKAQEVAALEERQRLARELHDSVSQALFGIGLGARTARAQLERDAAQAAQSIDYVLSLTQSGMAEMRALIFELRPESLETEGLVQALKKQADAVSARHEIPVSPTLCDEPVLPLPVKEALYRIAQEALHNAVKHARPRSVELFLEWNERALILEIRDDGEGFDTGGSFPGHLGLHSMRERAQRVGGSLEVESRIGEGTRVRVRVPARSEA